MNRFDQPVYLPLAASRRLLHSALAAHAAIAVALCSATTYLPAALGMGLLLLGHAAWWWRTRCHARADGVVALLYRSEGDWRVTLRDGRVVAASLAGRPLVSVSLTAISLRLEKLGLRHVLITPDAVPAAPYRRLRVRLRFAPAARREC